ncbi:hypothetical protein CAP36_05905 [Chitinophagaceae bacterium IBVUCB2]|nr:hypothetical protein CAP36_05905 [Chitinophagaceae bacterium IBVUCB2]
MRLFFIIVFFFFASTAESQQLAPAKMIAEQEIQCPANETIAVKDLFFCILEIDAKIDEKQWLEYLVKSLELDSLSMNIIPSGTYQVIAQFIIDTSGKISEIGIVSNPCYGLGKRVTKSLSAYPGCWVPAERNGRKIKAFRRQVITFIVGEEEACSEIKMELTL